jgi:hypothetical protein
MQERNCMAHKDNLPDKIKWNKTWFHIGPSQNWFDYNNIGYNEFCAEKHLQNQFVLKVSWLRPTFSAIQPKGYCTLDTWYYISKPKIQKSNDKKGN